MKAVLAAVGKGGCALKNASGELGAGKGVILAAVGQNRYALEYASDELNSKKEVRVRAAARLERAKGRYGRGPDSPCQYGYALRYAPGGLGPGPHDLLSRPPLLHHLQAPDRGLREGAQGARVGGRSPSQARLGL